MMELLGRSNIEIDKISCGEVPTLIESRLLILTDDWGFHTQKIRPRLMVVQTLLRLSSR